MNLSNTAILNIKTSDYHCIISLIGKNEAITLMEKADLSKMRNIIKNKNLKYKKWAKSI